MAYIGTILPLDPIPSRPLRSGRQYVFCSEIMVEDVAVAEPVTVATLESKAPLRISIGLESGTAIPYVKELERALEYEKLVSRMYEYKILHPLIYSSILLPLYRVDVLKIEYALWSKKRPAPYVPVAAVAPAVKLALNAEVVAVCAPAVDLIVYLM
jgi:hypothetical protein